MNTVTFILVTLALTACAGIALRVRFGPKRVFGKYQDLVIFGGLGVLTIVLVLLHYNVLPR